MISDNHTRYGSRLCRHGKSRACSSYQAGSSSRNVGVMQLENGWSLRRGLKVVKGRSAESSLLCLGLGQAQIGERIPNPHRPIPASMLKILREDFCQRVVLRVSPQMG